MRRNITLPKIFIFFVSVAVCVGLLPAAPALASGWTATNITSGTPMSGGSWAFVSTSGSGKYVVAFSSGYGFYNSSDYGASWTPSADSGTLGSLVLTSITMSYSGKYVAAESQSGDIYISQNYGVNWTNKTAGTSMSGLSWANIVMGASGQYIVAAANNQGLFISSDYGASWKNVQPGTAIAGLWMNAATISSDGKYLAIVNGSDVYGSRDYGATWSSLTAATPLSGGAFYSITSSSDGKIIYAAVDWGDIYISRDYGATWSNVTTGTTGSGKDWGYLQTNPTGQFILARYGTAAGNGIYASGNFGASWTEITSSLGGSPVWDSPTISASGQYIYAGTDVGPIYKFNDPSLRPAQPVITRQNITTTVSANSSVTVNVLGGVSNYDPDTLAIVSGPSHGTAVDPPGDITYTPSKGYKGTDSLVYQLCAPLDDTVCSQATLSFTVIDAPSTGYGAPKRNTPIALLTFGGSLLAIGIGVRLYRASGHPKS